MVVKWVKFLGPFYQGGGYDTNPFLHRNFRQHGESDVLSPKLIGTPLPNAYRRLATRLSVHLSVRFRPFWMSAFSILCMTAMDA